MFEGLVSSNQVNFLFVFWAGISSFLSPCILPLIPVYISFLAGNAKVTDDEGNITYKRGKVLKHTIFFVLGISCAFFLLGMTFTALGDFFFAYKVWITRIGGIIIIFLGLFQLGILNFRFMQKEKKIHLNLSNKEVNPFLAFVMGFTFSFSWTPCVGPVLSSVLLLASGAKSAAVGNVLILVYTLGFVIPFLLLGTFTTQVLNFFKKNRKLMFYTVKITGVLLVMIGVLTFTGWMNGISGYLNSIANKQLNAGTAKEETIPSEEAKESIPEESTTKESEARVTPPSIDFTLVDQYGKEHKLSDYRGKVVFLNFWATWCGPCKIEMPHIEALYKQYNLNAEDVIFLGVANPRSAEYPNNSDESKEDIIKFLDDNNLTFPVVFDETSEVFTSYRITAFPTTFMIDPEGNIFGYVTGTMDKETMEDIIQQTIDSKK